MIVVQMAEKNVGDLGCFDACFHHTLVRARPMIEKNHVIAYLN